MFSIIENMLNTIFTDVMGKTLSLPFQRMTYRDAMDKYGTDKPDLRFSLELKDVSSIVSNSSFKVFLDTIAKGGIVKGLNAKGLAGYSRRELDLLTAKSQEFGAKGLAWMKVKSGLESPISKFFPVEIQKQLIEALDAQEGDLLLYVADSEEVVNNTLCRLRIEIAERLQLIQKDVFKFLWVTDFPLLQWNNEEGRYEAMHHPFTSPSEKDIAKILNESFEPDKLKAQAYDIVLNGTEIGGGSIRIHSRKLQDRMFEILGIAKEDRENKFGFLMDALGYGAPPHGGIALGLDRFVMFLVGAHSIRDVIAFPKTQKAYCLMSNAPSPVTEKQLRELSIKLR
jgi:aspartyl-tRNA synthetase